MVPTSGEICGDRCYILRVLCACGTLAHSTSLPAPTPTVALPTVALPRADTHENTKKSSAVGPGAVHQGAPSRGGRGRRSRDRGGDRERGERETGDAQQLAVIYGLSAGASGGGLGKWRTERSGRRDRAASA